MLPCEVYREAAFRVEMGKEHFSCHAIRNVAEPVGAPAVRLVEAYENLFKPDGRCGSAWMVDFPKADWDELRTAQDRRVLALCFMAAVAEAGDL